MKGKTIIVLTHELFEDLELWYPVHRLREEGARVLLAGPEKGATYKGKNGVPATTDVAIRDIEVNGIDGVVIPGGYAPDKLRRMPETKTLVKQADESSKPIAMICHAGWVPISAKIVEGRKVTSVGAIKDDLVNAGAQWVDEAVVVDKNLVSSRTPDDLPVYVKSYIALF